MILHGNQRGGGHAMAQHVLNTKDNDQVQVHEVKGFMAGDVMGAMQEAHALAKGTRCKQYLFSLSFNPPFDAEPSLHDFEKAIERAEQALGLDDQPRVVVFHEKEGRRHAHVIWSRIDTVQMKAVNLSHYKWKLFGLSRDLFIEHEWELPKGHRHLGGASPDNFTMAQWQQAQRLGLHPKEIKQSLQTAWAQSDDLKSFAAAIHAQGYRLAKGDRRGFVAVDLYGEVYSVPRWLGIKTKDVKSKLGSPETLPTVDAATQDITSKVSQRLLNLIESAKARQTSELTPQIAGKRTLTQNHRKERTQLAALHAQRWQRETYERQQSFNRGWRGIWDRITGRYARLKANNELDMRECLLRDTQEREALFLKQQKQRRALQNDIDHLRSRHVRDRRRMNRMIADYLGKSASSLTPQKSQLTLSP